MYLEMLLLSFIHAGNGFDDCPLYTWRVALSKPITSPLERSPPSNHVGGETGWDWPPEPVIKVHQRKPAVGRTKEVVPTQHYRTLHNTTEHYTTLQNTTEHYRTLHNTTEHYTTLQYARIGPWPPPHYNCLRSTPASCWIHFQTTLRGPGAPAVMSETGFFYWDQDEDFWQISLVIETGIELLTYSMTIFLFLHQKYFA